MKLAQVILLQSEASRDSDPFIGPPYSIRDEKVYSKKPRVMLVDDDKDITGLYSLILSNHGYPVSHIAHDGQEAIRIIEQNDDVDVLIIDQRMPELDGLLAAKKIREIRPSLKIAMVSAYDVPKDEGYPFDIMISKPISSSTLIDLVRKLDRDFQE